MSHRRIVVDLQMAVVSFRMSDGSCAPNNRSHHRGKGSPRWNDGSFNRDDRRCDLLKGNARATDLICRRLRISHRTFLSVAVFPFRLSDFGLLSDFGDSDFGVRSSGLIITVTTHRSLFHFSVGRLPRKTNSEKRPTPNTFGVGHELVSRLQGVELSRKNTVPLAGFTVTFTVPAPPPG